MSELSRIIILICIMIIIFLLTRKFMAWRMKRAYHYVIEDLKQKQALNPSTAVELPYAKTNLLGLGLRDFRPKAVEYLVLGDILARTESGKYYLKDQNFEFMTADHTH